MSLKVNLPQVTLIATQQVSFSEQIRLHYLIVGFPFDEHDIDINDIQVNYDPLKLITALKSCAGIPGDDNKKKLGLLYYMLMWDEEQQRIKCTTVPKALADMVQNRD